jgi:putative transposase
VDLRTLQRAFHRELTPAFVAGVTVGQRARRAKLVYLERQATFRNQVWESDHKCLPVLVLPPRGRAVTMFIDDATRVITGWAIALTPHAGTVLTSLRMGMLEDAAYGVAHGVPRLLRLDRGLEFAAAARSPQRPARWARRPGRCRATTRTARARSSARS